MNCVALTDGLAGQLIHGMLHDWFIVQSGGSQPPWNFQYNGESGLANERKVFFLLIVNG